MCYRHIGSCLGQWVRRGATSSQQMLECRAGKFECARHLQEFQLMVVSHLNAVKFEHEEIYIDIGPKVAFVPGCAYDAGQRVAEIEMARDQPVANRSRTVVIFVEERHVHATA